MKLQLTSFLLLFISIIPTLKIEATPRFLSLKDSCDLNNGDLVFVVNEEKENPITSATVHDPNLLPIEHVAIIYKTDESVRLIEALPQKGVILTTWHNFVARNNKIIAGRINQDNVNLNSCVIRATTFIGLEYDELFMLDTNRIYCSELVQVSYIDNNNQSIFDLIPMSFSDDMGNILPYWLNYYHSKGLWVPQGALGTNPSSIATSGKITLLE